MEHDLLSLSFSGESTTGVAFSAMFIGDSSRVRGEGHADRDRRLVRSRSAGYRCDSMYATRSFTERSFGTSDALMSSA
jgi:hypothetical protein